MPLGGWLRNGYLVRGATLGELAAKAGIDASALEAMVARYNRTAVHGEDPDFGRGTTAFNRYLADPAHKPNPCVAPVAQGPVLCRQTGHGRSGQLRRARHRCRSVACSTPAPRPIAGLYAVGNDRASMMGGAYPGAGITLGPIMTFGYITGRHLAGIAD